MPRQTSIQLTEATEQQIAYLASRGYGTTTSIIRTAIDRMVQQEGYQTMKRFTATAGSKDNPVTTAVEMRAAGPLTPEQARAAAKIAFGHTQGVTVSDGSATYRLQGKSARKVNTDAE